LMDRLDLTGSHKDEPRQRWYGPIWDIHDVYD
jgi:hypothetical protein